VSTRSCFSIPPSGEFDLGIIRREPIVAFCFQLLSPLKAQSGAMDVALSDIFGVQNSQKPLSLCPLALGEIVRLLGLEFGYTSTDVVVLISQYPRSV
jgi:hypothetical protein